MDASDPISNYVVGGDMFEPGHDRVKLRFAESVLFEFQFIVDEYGFRVTKTGSTYVRFEKLDVFVEVWHGRGSYALGVNFGRWVERQSKRVAESLPLKYLVDALDVADKSGFRYYQTAEAKPLARFIRHYAEIVRTYAPPLLRNEPGLFQMMENEFLEQAEIENQTKKAARLCAVAEKAFAKKDYGTVCTAYSEVIRDLDKIKLEPSHLKRLEIASKYLEEA